MGAFYHWFFAAGFVASDNNQNYLLGIGDIYYVLGL